MNTKKRCVPVLFATLSLVLLPMACRPGPAPEKAPETVTLSGHFLAADGQAPKMANISFARRSAEGPGLHLEAADETGAFSIALPKGLPLNVRFTAVDHEEIVLPILLDADATLEIQLKPNPFRESFDSVRIVGPWNRYSMAKPDEMQAQKDGTFVREVESQEETIGYELGNITTNDHWVNGTMADAFEYDGGGDYRSLIHPSGGKALIVFDPKLLPRYPSEGLPKFDFDEAHEDLETMGTLAVDHQGLLSSIRKAMVLFMEKGGNPKDFRFEGSELKNELLMAIGHGASKLVRGYAAILLASDSRQIPGLELSDDEWKAVREAAPARSRIWTFQPAGLHAAGREYPDFLKDVLDHSPDALVQREALAALISDAATKNDMASAREYYARLKKDYGKLPGSSFMLAEINPDKKIRAGNALPDFSLKLMDGTPITRDDLKGHWTLIDFWATWCGPCVGEMPNLKAAWEKFHPRGFEILSISLDATPEDVEKFRKGEWKMPWKNVFLEGGFQSETARDFELFGIPKPLLISPDGKIEAVEPETRGKQLLNTIEAAMHTADEDAGHE